jgi:antitoxin (DNA-binding transcriptional repressor) of toxin-antitoxin stability system
MNAHNTIEANAQLLELVERARKGEDVIITHLGEPVAKISGLPPEASPPKRMTQEAIDWLINHMPAGKMPEEDAGTFVSRMRDEEWAR